MTISSAMNVLMKFVIFITFSFTFYFSENDDMHPMLICLYTYTAHPVITPQCMSKAPAGKVVVKASHFKVPCLNVTKVCHISSATSFLPSL